MILFILEEDGEVTVVDEEGNSTPFDNEDEAIAYIETIVKEYPDVEYRPNLSNVIPITRKLKRK